MKTKIAPFAALTLLVPLALALAGCFGDGNMHGGDDYPNSVEPMGRQAAYERADSSEWNAYEGAPAGATGMYDTTPVPSEPPSQGAPKRGARQLSPSLDIGIGVEIAGAARAVLSDSIASAGLLRTVRTQILPGAGSFSAVDTMWYQAIPGGVRVVRASGSVSFAGDVRYTFFEDGDGDGFLSPAGAASSVLVRVVTVLASGKREERATRMSAGPDGDFNKADDNVLISLHKLAMHSLDTLLSLKLIDVDGDGFLYNPLRDSNQVGVESKVAGDEGRTELFYRLNTFADSSRNYAYRYRKVITTARGIEETTALGRDSLPDFGPGDSGVVGVRFISTVPGDTLASSESRYGVRLSSSRGDAGGNRLLRVERVKVFRAGPLSTLHYTLSPDAPVQAGGFARNGALFLRADLRSGGWIQLAGRADAEITGTVTDSEGRKGTVRLRADGSVKSASGF